MNRPIAQTLVLILPALALGVAAVAFASAVDPLALRIVLQAAAITAAAMLWCVASGDDAESGNSSTQPISKSIVRALGSDRRLTTYDRDSGLCAVWYFRLRAEEEIGRATRYGQPLTVLTLASESKEVLGVARIALKATLRQVDFAGDLGNKLAAVLPQTDRAGAMVVAERVKATSPEIVVRVAQYPVDGATLSHLLGDDEWRTAPIATDYVA